MINDGTHNILPGKRRMCACCEERPARVGFMCEVCLGLGAPRERVEIEGNESVSAPVTTEREDRPT